MNAANYQIIQEILGDLLQEQNQIKNEINANLVKIQEAEFFIHSLLEKEDSDYKVFSPRNIESVYKSELAQVKKEKEFYEEKNRELSIEEERIDSKIEQVKKILSEEKGQDYITLSIQEADRQRIARDLHDTSLQNLAHLVHKIELSSMYIDQDPLRAKLELSVVNKNLKLVIEEIRNTIFDLRPMTFDDLGMKAALERLIAVINENRTYEIESEIDDVSCENNLVLVSIYRIIQEGLTNIVKHAEATKISIQCKVIGKEYHIVLKDNGKGFTREELNQKEGKHFGLSLMEERVTLIGGNIVIQSDNEGTVIQIKVPLDK